MLTVNKLLDKGKRVRDFWQKKYQIFAQPDIARIAGIKVRVKSHNYEFSYYLFG
jgi:hypothetical protein